MTPAELLAVVLGLFVALLTVRLRRAWIPWAGAASLLTFGLWVAGVRNGSVAGLVPLTPDDAVAALAAASHASAARALWVTATVGAALLAVDAVAHAVQRADAESRETRADVTSSNSSPAPVTSMFVPQAARPSSGQPVVRSGIPGVWVTPLLGVVLVFVAPLVPPLIAIAGPVLAVALAVRRRPDPRPVRDAAGTVLLVAIAAVAAADETLFDRLRFVSATDIRRVDLLVVVRAALVGVALAAAAHAAWLHRRAGGSSRVALGVATLLAVGVGIERRSTAGATAWGPPAALARVAADLPTVRPAPTARPRGGCLVRAAGDGEWTGATVGHPAPTRGTIACPATVRPGAFPPDAVPLLALAASAPIGAVHGWHGGGVGQVALLTRVGVGSGMPAWRVGLRRIEAWDAPHGVRARPLPGSVLLSRDPDGWSLTHAGGVEAVAQPGPAARRALAGTHRADLLIHPSAAPTAAALVALCDEVAPDPRAGIRCVLVGDDREAWRAALAPRPPPVDDGPPPEVIFDDEALPTR